MLSSLIEAAQLITFGLFIGIGGGIGFTLTTKFIEWQEFRSALKWFRK